MGHLKFEAASIWYIFIAFFLFVSLVFTWMCVFLVMIHAQQFTVLENHKEHIENDWYLYLSQADVDLKLFSKCINTKSMFFSTKKNKQNILGNVNGK